MNVRYMVFVLIAGLVIVGCTQQKGELYGKAITENDTVDIIDIFKNKEKYLGKVVRVEGKIESECPTGCWFNVMDQTGLLYIDLTPAQLAIPQKVGHQVVLQGKVMERSGSLMIHGTGVMIK